MNLPAPNIGKYCQIMEEIKKRDLVIRGFLSGRCRTLFKATNLESICLQVRKILELIALGSMVANKEEFSKYHQKIHKYWHGGRLLKDLEKINQNFYPKPITENSSQKRGIRAKWKELEGGYLTKEDFIKLYEKCGKILHADNPFGSKIDYEFYERQISLWLDKIVKLLGCHQIHLLNDNNIYLIHMKEDRDDKVHGYTFAPVKEGEVDK